ncbi:MAG: MobA/MobL family protein [Terrimicrobiaceae bacterium]|nr:MobA/MobL family protein [Terrimicrobiaceae bacterium]
MKTSRPNAKGDDRNVHGHLFMTTRAVDAAGTFSKAKIRNLDDRKLGPIEVERIREMWEVRCNRALRKAGASETVDRHSLKIQGVDRPATKHLGAKATAMTRNGCRMRKAEINELISSDSRRLAEIKSQLNQLKNHDHRSRRQIHRTQSITASERLDMAATGKSRRSNPERPTDGMAVSGKSRHTHNGNRPAGNRSRTRPARTYAGRELARLLAGRASIGRIAQGHHFRGGQLLVGLLRTLRVVIRILEIEQQRQQQRAGIRMKP